MIAFFFVVVGIVLLTLFVLVLFWDDYRLVVLGGMGATFFALGTMVALWVHNLSQAKSKLFSDSLAELNKDKSHLDAAYDRPESL